jgi:hypothetical protein
MVYSVSVVDLVNFVYFVDFVYLVYLVDLVYLVCLVISEKREKGLTREMRNLPQRAQTIFKLISSFSRLPLTHFPQSASLPL